jgi:hypothetical protein
MADKPRKTLADYVAIAISPALIMALVGSLVFFLLEILYQGDYQARLQWILFFFVFGAVLVARISMTEDIAGRAGLYGLILGFLCWLGLQLYVEYPPGHWARTWGWAINFGLIIIIWWSAHRLTWDCTLIDDQVDASGAGLLEVAGLEKTTTPERNKDNAEPRADKRRPKDEKGGVAGWLDRYRKYREERKKKPHAPGVWVVYFSLAALPLFGLGQAQIPVSEEKRRAYAFFLMLIYAGSGLGLLLTTSFLGLRRYLRQRKAQMPATITTVWLTLGAMLVATLLLLGALLPRPDAPSPLLEWTGLLNTEKRKASDQAIKGDSPGKGQGKAASEGPKDKNDAKDAKGEGKGKGPSDPKDVKGTGKTDEKKGQGDAKGDSKGQGKSDGKKGEQSKGKDSGKDDGKAEDREAAQNQPKSAPSRNPLAGLLDKLGPILKFIILAALVILIVFFVLRAVLRFLANFTNWAQGLLAFFRNLWISLFSWGSGKAGVDDDAEAERVRRPKPFSAYPDPFLTGAADRLSPNELVRYSFEALEAWAYERDLPRQVGETPLEFGGRVGDEFPALEDHSLRLANYYVLLAYTRRGLGEECKEPLRRFWQMLLEVSERPLSAGTV